MTDAVEESVIEISSDDSVILVDSSVNDTLELKCVNTIEELFTREYL